MRPWVGMAGWPVSLGGRAFLDRWGSSVRWTGVPRKGMPCSTSRPRGSAFDPSSLTPILSDGNDSPVLTTRNSLQLTDSQIELRNLVQQRSLTAARFREKVVELKPDLADFLDEVQRTGGLHYRLHPVGFVIAKHVIASHAPKMAEAVDAALEEHV
jgi:hypothetical protein